MNLLVVGSGGREHALAWRLAQSPRIGRIYVAPGNAGTAREDGLFNAPIASIPELVEFARKESIALTVVGPEAPLSEGIVDAFHAAGLKIFGPTRQVAQLESSKDFAKSFMVANGIPTAAYATFSDARAAREYVRRQGAPIVIKADGLAAGARVVIEEFLEGEEASFIVMVDGKHVLPLASSQDHKRLLDGDHGPNTGGMGAYSPAPALTPTIHARVMREVIQPVVGGMDKQGTPYTGFLYAGLMI